MSCSSPLWGRLHDLEIVRTAMKNALHRGTETVGDCRPRLWKLEGPCGAGKKALLRYCWEEINSDRPTDDANTKGFMITGRSPSSSRRAAQSRETVDALCAALWDAVADLLDVLEETTFYEIMDMFCQARSDWDLLHEAFASLSVSREAQKRLEQLSVRFDNLNSDGRDCRDWNKKNKGLPPPERSRTPSSDPIDVDHGECRSPRLRLGLVTPVQQSLEIALTLLNVASTVVPLVVVVVCIPTVLGVADSKGKRETSGTLESFLIRDESEHSTSQQGPLFVICCDTNDSTIVSLSISSSLVVSPKYASSPYQTQRLRLDNLPRKDVKDWISAWYPHAQSSHDTDESMLHSMTDLVHQRTLGNPRQIHYVLMYIELFGTRSFETMNDALSLTVDELFRCIVRKQSNLVQRVVEITAAMGRDAQGGEWITSDMLETVLQEPCTEALSVAHKLGLVEWNGRRVMFGNVVFQDAAYELIESDQPRSHYRIGRRLWKNSTMADSNSADDVFLLFLVAQQLELGAGCVDDLTERTAMAQIQWQARKSAMQLSLFARAAGYFDAAIDVLRDDIWSTDLYDLTLALHNAAAEAFYCAGDFDSMEQKLNAVFARAATFDDTLQACNTLVFASGARHRLREAVTTALDLLNKLHEPIPADPSMRLVIVQFNKTQRLLKGRNDRFFCSLPSATDHNKIAAMTLLSFICLYSYSLQPQHGVYCLSHSIRLAIEHGITPAVLSSFSLYGVALANRFGRVDEGYRFGQIALRLLDQVESRAWLSRVYFMVYGVINSLVHPFRECLEPLLYAQRLDSGRETLKALFSVHRST